jgi:hypothetical protein
VQVEVFDDAGEFLLDAPATILVGPEVGVGHLEFEGGSTLGQIVDTQVAGGLVEAAVEGIESWREVLHGVGWSVSGRDSA